MTTIESLQCVLVCACVCCLVSLSWCHNRLATHCTDAAVLMLCSFNCHSSAGQSRVKYTASGILAWHMWHRGECLR